MKNRAWALAFPCPALAPASLRDRALPKPRSGEKPDRRAVSGRLGTMTILPDTVFVGFGNHMQAHHDFVGFSLLPTRRNPVFVRSKGSGA